MSLFGKIANFLGGSIVKTIASTIKDHFPPSMSDKEKADLFLKTTEIENARNVKIMEFVNEADKEFNNRIKDLEGTAGDLLAIPVAGHIILFLRGSQRPIWGFFTLFADYQAWSSAWSLTERQEAMLLVVNILVLGFLFSERCVKNVMPFLVQFFGKKSLDKT